MTDAPSARVCRRLPDLRSQRPGQDLERARAGGRRRRRRPARLDDGRFHGERDLTGAQLSAALGETAAASTATVRVTAFRRAAGRPARPLRRRRPRPGHARARRAQPAAHVRHRGRRPLPRSATNHPGLRRRARALPVGADHPRRGRALLRDVLQSGDWASRTPAASSAPSTSRPTTRDQARAPRRGVEDRHALHLGRRDRRTSSTYGYQAHGGYDCSGLRLAHLQALEPPAAHGSAAAPRRRWRGRSPSRERLRLDELAPGDLVFFGTAKFNGKATEAGVDHVGIALSPHWMIHSGARASTSPRSTTSGAGPLHLGPPRTLNLGARAVRRPRIGMRRKSMIATGALVAALGVATTTGADARPAATYKLSADKSRLKFNKSTIRAKAGKVTLSMSNPRASRTTSASRARATARSSTRAARRPSPRRSRRAPTPSTAPSARTRRRGMKGKLIVC